MLHTLTASLPPIQFRSKIQFKEEARKTHANFQRYILYSNYLVLHLHKIPFIRSFILSYHLPMYLQFIGIATIISMEWKILMIMIALILLFCVLFLSFFSILVYIFVFVRPQNYWQLFITCIFTQRIYEENERNVCFFADCNID